MRIWHRNLNSWGKIIEVQPSAEPARTRFLSAALHSHRSRIHNKPRQLRTLGRIGDSDGQLGMSDGGGGGGGDAFQFLHPITVVVSRPTSCGKTYYVVASQHRYNVIAGPTATLGTEFWVTFVVMGRGEGGFFPSFLLFSMHARRTSKHDNSNRKWRHL